MKIIVGGAGSVGQSIVGYLAQGSNDIIVVDNDSKRLDELSQIADVRPINGSISYPGIQEKFGAKSADMLIAVTDSDETNMVACQIAYSLFNLPKRIARIDSEAYLSPLWSTLYNESNLPIDLIISPEQAIAEAIYRLLKVPGTSEYLPFFNDKLYLLAFRCQPNCPLLKTPIEQLSMIAPDLEVSLLSIVRGGHSFIPKGTDWFEAGDEVYFLTAKDKIDDAVHAFDMDRPAVERVVIFGGGQIALNLALKLESDDNILSCKIVEENPQIARQLAKELDDTVVINGAMLNDSILDEVAIEHADMAIAVTSQDKDNLLVSLLAKQNGATSVISLVNSQANNNLVDNIGDNILVHRSAITISKLLKEIRQNKIDFAYSLGKGFGEIWVIEIDENMNIAEHKISSLRLSSGIKIGAILRDDKIIYPSNSEILHLGDTILIYANSGQIRRAEQIFA